MNKPQLAVAAAAVLALLGFGALFLWAQGAEDRAFEGVERTTVLQVTEEVPARTAAGDLSGSVEEVELPKAAVVPGALASLDDVSGLVTRGVLVPGDQLSTAKFAQASDVATGVEVPKGMQELSFALEPQRVIGGALQAGDRVGVMASYSGKTANPINEVLVLRVGTGVAEGDSASSGMITVAVKTLDAEKIVHAMEFGKVWLTRQNDDTDTGGGKTIDSTDVAP